MDFFKKFQFPRPSSINFPEVQNQLDIKMEFSCSSPGDDFSVGQSICALKSGNILISKIRRDEKSLEIKSTLEIYSIPHLKLIEEYEFESTVKGVMYQVVYATQLNNGNIISICDRLYEFDGEKISKGYIRTSEMLKGIYYKTINISFKDPFDIFNKKAITKQSSSFQAESIIHIDDEKLLFTMHLNHMVYLLDINNLNGNINYLYELEKKRMIGSFSSCLDIIFQSQYYPSNLYICANDANVDAPVESNLLIFDIKQFCIPNKDKNALATINVSKSENVYGYCEYDKKYLLLDTIHKGIYIIDIESKSKVAVCEPKIKEQKSSLIKSLEFINKVTPSKKTMTFSRFEDIKKGNLYRKMKKLDDGHVITCYYAFNLIDIKNENIVKKAVETSAKVDYVGKYAVSLYFNSEIVVCQIYE